MSKQGSWLKGFVKEVQSADQITVTNYGLPPTEKRLTLSSLIAPRLARGTGKDEPFAWEGREYLRKLAVGKQCYFSNDYQVPNVNREFGSVLIQGPDNQQLNLAVAVVQQGFAKVRKEGQFQSPFINELTEAESQAEHQQKGLWNQDSETIRKATRELPLDNNAQVYFSSKGKGASIQGVVEVVITGSLVRITSLETFSSFSILLTGIQSPPVRPQSGQNENTASSGNQALQQSQSVKGAQNGSVTNGSANVASKDQKSQVSLGQEAKFFTERVVLNRDVTVVLDNIDTQNQGGLYGTLYYKNSKGEQVNLAQQLLACGYARIIEGSIRNLSQGVKHAAQYRQFEFQAKQQRLKLWKDYVIPQSDSKSFQANVIEVVSVDTLVVQGLQNQQETRVSLASIRGPTIKRQENKVDPYYYEAKEFLRKKLIGREVSVTIEYERKVQSTLASSSDDLLVIRNANIVLEEKTSKGNQQINIAEIVVRQGYASPVRHGQDDQRSSIYDQLVIAEDEARGEKLNIHNPNAPKDPTTTQASRGVDISQPGTGDRAKHFLGALQKGKTNAICEFVLAGHRVRLYIPSQQLIIAFSLSGVKAPARPQPARGKLPAVKGEPYADEAYAFTRQNVLQRNVLIEVDTVDKMGSFLGTLEIPLQSQQQQKQGGKTSLNLGVELLSKGLAAIHPGFPVNRLRLGTEYLQAQNGAKSKKLKVWENYEEVDESDQLVVDKNNVEKSFKDQEGVEVTVTELLDATTFYIQNLKDQQIKKLSDILAGLSLQDSDSSQFIAPESLQRGKKILAKSLVDNIWYRGYIEGSEGRNNKYRIYLLDVGSVEVLPADRLRQLNPNLAQLKPQAQFCKLAYVRAPKPSTQYGIDAAEYVAGLVKPGQNLKIQAKTQSIEKIRVTHPQYENGIRYLILQDPQDSNTVNEKLLLSGLGITDFTKVKPVEDVIYNLQGLERQARSKHLGIFEHGDPGDSDEEI